MLVDFVHFNKKLSLKFDCVEKILGILYGNIDEKFVVDPETGKCYLNPDVIRNLKDCNTF